MNATIQSQLAPGTRNRGQELIASPKTKIEIMFFPIFMFESSIKDMNPVFTEEKEEKSASATRPQVAPQADAGPAATLKTPRFPECPAYSPPKTTKNPVSDDRHDSDVFDASLRALNRRARRDPAMPELKLVEFSVDLPYARKVQLVADFTDWDEAPLDLIQFAGGIWSTTIPLPPGIYAYHFLVDGEWYNDPRAMRSGSAGPGRSIGNGYIQIK